MEATDRTAYVQRDARGQATPEQLDSTGPTPPGQLDSTGPTRPGQLDSTGPTPRGQLDSTGPTRPEQLDSTGRILPGHPAADVTIDSGWAARVRRLAAERDAVILAHNYQRPEIQEVADHVGDSLALARLAAASSAQVIVLCGVYFMAETAKILAPERTVLIPDARAGCSLADSITVEQLLAWKAEHPDAAVVAYVNTSAEVKALADVCCTSANAAEIVAAIPAEREVLFLPDQFLGAHVRRVTGRENLHVWAGECHVHAGISPQALRDMAAANPEAELFVHPECGCGTSALWQTGTGDLPAERTRVLSTGGMLTAARSVRAPAVLVATETGMLHQLRKANPAVRWEPVNPHATCHYMKMITASALERCLRDGAPEVRVAPDVAARARRAVEAMIAVGPIPAGAS
jgi:quinolinate synthase